MAKRKKKDERTLIALLLAIALAAYLYNAGYLSGGGPGGSPQPTPSTDSGKCCCADPFAYIVQLPGGECQCLTCPEANPNVLVKEEGMCCTANTCGGGPE